MLESPKESKTDQNQNPDPEQEPSEPAGELTYKIIFGFQNTAPDASTVRDDVVHKEVVRVIAELAARLRADYPSRGILLDVTEIAVCSEPYIV